jgi:hypothetical protein
LEGHPEGIPRAACDEHVVNREWGTPRGKFLQKKNSGLIFINF